jgi:hypothetical protein
MSEKCQNPWKHNPECENTDIKITIQITKIKRGMPEITNYQICKECWVKIADSNKEWGLDLKPDFSRRALPKEDDEQ